MEKNNLKKLFKCIYFGVLWGIVVTLLGIITTSIRGYDISEVLFIEGIVVIGIGLFSFVGGDSMGLSLNGLGSQSAQYSANVSLDTTDKDRENSSNFRKINFELGRSGIAILVGGIIPVVISFLI